MPSSIEIVINQALRDIGSPKRIGNIYEGTEIARASLDVYGQTRDELIDAGEWPFSYRNLPLTLLKGPPPPGGYNPFTPWGPTYPPPGYLYEYGYPDDMIELTAILPTPGAMFQRWPEPALWRVANDNTGVDRNGVTMLQRKVILTNTVNSVAVYRAQVTDPNLWEPGFISVLVPRIAAKLVAAIGQSIDMKKEEVTLAAGLAPIASANRG